MHCNPTTPSHFTALHLLHSTPLLHCITPITLHPFTPLHCTHYISPPLHCTSLHFHYYISPCSGLQHSSAAHAIAHYCMTSAIHCTSPALHGTHCTAFPCTSLHVAVPCTAPYFTTLHQHCTALHTVYCISLQGAVCTVFHCTVQCSALHCILQPLSRTALHCILLHRAVIFTGLHLHLTPLYLTHCTVQCTSPYCTT